MADNVEEEFNRCISNVCSTFNISQLNEYQLKALNSLVVNKKDTFVNLPTGCGKSLIYQSLPLFNNLSSIVIVVSPLINLMRDQVRLLNSLGISSICLSFVDDETTRKEVENGHYCVVYGSPESWISERWRKMLSNSTYSKRICAVAVDEAHVINHWGTSKSVKKAAFRESFSKLNELRSLVPSCTPFVALTATATQATKVTIFSALRMKDCVEIVESPNKPNITYSVTYMEKTRELEDYLQWIVKTVIENGIKTPRIIIYCQTIKQSHLLYSMLRAKLGNAMFKDGVKNPHNAFVEMLHSCTPVENKSTILQSFQDKTGIIRVLVATIAFGMGVDCKGVRTVVHFGPSKNVEAYIQECGRAGRDGEPSHVWLLYNGIMQIHTEPDMKAYLKTKECRRQHILRNFDDNFSTQHAPLHTCCDNCASLCNCGSPDCKTFTSYPISSLNNSDYVPSKVRNVSSEQRRKVKEELILYRKELVKMLMSKSPGGGLKSVINPRFLLGFSTLQVEQVISNLDKLFTIEDITTFVEIWHMKHAQVVQNILMKVFSDIPVYENNQSDSDSSDEDEELDMWVEAMCDDEKLEMLSDSMNRLEVDESLQTTASSLDITPEQINVFDDI